MSNLAQRLLTAGIGVPVILALNYLAPPWAFLLLVLGAAAASSIELCTMIAPDRRDLAVVGPIVSVATVLAVWTRTDDPRVWATVAAAVPVVALVTLLARPGDLKRLPATVSALALGILYTGLLPGFVALLQRTPRIGPDLLVLLLTVAFLGDTFGYFGGRAFGAHKLYPAISPAKTWEGAVAGLVGSSGAGVLASLWYLPEIELSITLPLCAAAGALGQVGDLCESMLKRACGVKDSGRLLPGHGGMLDRIDAVLFAAPTIYLTLMWLGLLESRAG